MQEPIPLAEITASQTYQDLSEGEKAFALRNWQDQTSQYLTNKYGDNSQIQQGMRSAVNDAMPSTAIGGAMVQGAKDFLPSKVVQFRELRDAFAQSTKEHFESGIPVVEAMDLAKADGRGRPTTKDFAALKSKGYTREQLGEAMRLFESRWNQRDATMGFDNSTEEGRAGRLDAIRRILGRDPEKLRARTEEMGQELEASRAINADIRERMITPESQGLAEISDQSLMTKIAGAAPAVGGELAVAFLTAPVTVLQLGYFGLTSAASVNSRIMEDQPDMPVDERIKRSILSGTVSAGLDRIGFGSMTNAARRSGITSTLIAAGGEGATEYAQELVESVGALTKWDADGIDEFIRVIADPEVQKSAAFSALMGSLAGGTVRGGVELNNLITSKVYTSKIDDVRKSEDHIKEFDQYENPRELTALLDIANQTEQDIKTAETEADTVISTELEQDKKNAEEAWRHAEKLQAEFDAKLKGQEAQNGKQETTEPDQPPSEQDVGTRSEPEPETKEPVDQGELDTKTAGIPQEEGKVDISEKNKNDRITQTKTNIAILEKKIENTKSKPAIKKLNEELANLQSNLAEDLDQKPTSTPVDPKTDNEVKASKPEASTKTDTPTVDPKTKKLVKRKSEVDYLVDRKQSEVDNFEGKKKKDGNYYKKDQVIFDVLQKDLDNLKNTQSNLDKAITAQTKAKEAEVYEGRKIYSDGKMFGVSKPNNEPDFGDSLYKSIEEAKKDVDLQVKIAKSNAESDKKQKAKEETKAKKDDEKYEADHPQLNEFLETVDSPMKKGALKKTLEKPVKKDGVYYPSRAGFVKAVHEGGGTVETVNGKQVFMSEDGSYYTGITKAEITLFNHLDTINIDAPLTSADDSSAASRVGSPRKKTTPKTPDKEVNPIKVYPKSGNITGDPNMSKPESSRVFNLANINRLFTSILGRPAVIKRLLRNKIGLRGQYSFQLPESGNFKGQDAGIQLNAQLAAGPIVGMLPKNHGLTKEEIYDYVATNEDLEAEWGRIDPEDIILRNSGKVITVHKRDETYAAQVMAHEVGHWIDDMDFEITEDGQLTGNINERHTTLGRLFGLKHTKKRSFLNEQGTEVTDAEIRAELIKVTEAWRGPIEGSASYVAYRRHGAELYADAVSMLFNNPAKLKEMAPKFYKNFQEGLSSKPQLKKAFDEIVGQIENDTDTEAILDEQLKMNKAAEMKNKNSSVSGQTWMEEKLDWFIENAIYSANAVWSRRSGIWLQNRQNLNRVEKLQKELDKKGVLSPEKQAMLKKHKARLKKTYDQIKFTNQDSIYSSVVARNYLAIAERLEKDLSASGIEMNEFNTYLLNLRIGTGGDRSSYFNPQGITESQANANIKALMERMGPEKVATMEKYREEFLDMRKEVFRIIGEGRMLTDQMMDYIQNNKNYVRFDVFGEDNARLGLSSQDNSLIQRMTGTLRELEVDPFFATIQYDMMMINFSMKNRGKLALIEFIPNDEDVQDDTKRVIKGGKIRAKKVQGQFVPPRGNDYELMTVYRDGVAEGWHIPKEYDNLYETASGSKLISVARVFLKPVRKLWIEWNVPFALRNIVRDAQQTWVQGASLGDLIKSYRATARETWAATSQGKYSDRIVNMMLRAEVQQGEIAGLNADDLTDMEYVRTLNKAEKRAEGLRNALSKIHANTLKHVEDMNQFFENWTKVSTNYRMDGSDLTQQEKTYLTRSTGSPAFLDVGKYAPVMNVVSMFASPTMAGHKQQIEAYNRNPKQYVVRRAMITGLNQAFVLAALNGLFGDELEELMEKIPFEDHVGNWIIPITTNEKGEAIYIKIAKDHTQIILDGIIAGFAEGEMAKGFRPAFEGIPLINRSSDNPFWRGSQDMVSYFKGVSPVDRFGRQVVAKNLIGTSQGFRDLIAHEWDSVFGSIARFSSKGGVTAKIPIVEPVFDAFIGSSSFGEVQKEMKESRESQRGMASYVSDQVEELDNGLSSREISRESNKAWARYKGKRETSKSAFTRSFKSRYYRTKKR